ncbi:MAG TPA: acyl--CoA ligase [Gemmatimonadaceae bacterium]|jgi:acyl-CoA synthetase (AMP-forming)/AMP-acid ligase II|nr:acyl--CoA ligase [Gemmatimonadaceae bacterium]
MSSTIQDLLKAGRDDATALGSPGGVPLTYRALRAHVADVVRALNAQGIGANDRVGIVLDNGPEMAAAFLGIGSAATAAPLNPSYRAEEFEFYLTDLNAKLLVAAQSKDSPAIGVAQKLGVPIARLVPTPEKGAGSFGLEFDEARARSDAKPRAATPDDIALVLHTSGTTSRPKIVPLAHKNIAASASNIRRTLSLTANDRGLVIMPLFHIHGLIAALSAPLSAGGEVCCSPGFNALKFFSWFSDVRPTWYTGVPTMHQAILLRAANNPDSLKGHRLRFIRSSSSALPPTVISELERVFGVPVVEAYGMTEATHQMASNPLPPGKRKPGTVGPSGGPEIRVVDETGTTVPTGSPGEIVIRGPNVMREYENNPKANADAFYDGWFRTGDQGVMDEDGYVAIVGRLKEIINRGGEKISPREVDEIIMEHPAVHQCVTFAMPHEMLGEDVAAAIVLKQGSQATDRELRDFASSRLAPFKVPRKILILTEIPVGATGKLQRIGLAQKLGLS